MGEVACAEKRAVTQYCSVGATQSCFNRKAEVWPGRDLVHSCSVSKDRLKAQFVPTESSWAGHLESGIPKGLLGYHPVWLASQGQNREFRTVSPVRAEGWETGKS